MRSARAGAFGHTAFDPNEPRVDVFFCRLDTAAGSREAAYLPSLSHAERARSRAFRSDSARLQFISARYLVRNALSLYGDTAPHAWRFACNAYGRPDIAWPTGRRLAFNISHTNGVAAVAISRCSEIGLDVERIDRDVDFEGVADAVFTDQEKQHVFGGAPEEICARFFDLWTLKEAYIKARGMGFSLPPSSFEIDCAEGRIGLARQPTCDVDPQRWQFHLSTPRAGVRMALAIGSRRVTRLRVFEWRPDGRQDHGRILETSP